MKWATLPMLQLTVAPVRFNLHMIQYKYKSVLNFAEEWWDPSLASGADVTYYWGLQTPIPGIPAEEFHTVIIDLKQDEETLMKQMNSNTAYEIRRGAKEGLVYRSWFTDSGAVLGEFSEFYNQFAASKGLEPANENKLRVYSSSGVLDLCRVETSGGEVLVWHAYVRRQRYVRQLHSVSLFRATDDSKARRLVSRANRYQHWLDIQRFRSEGIETFDLGGWYAGTADPDRLKINEFKESFGGQVVCTYHQIQPRTLKGKLFRKYVEYKSSRQPA